METARLRLVAGAAIGAVIFALDAVSLLFDYAMYDYVSERAGTKEIRVLPLYAAIFAAAGALCGWLLEIRVRLLRYLLPATLAGAVVASYFTATWALRASAFTMGGPGHSVMAAAAAGAGLGAIAGLLLYAIGWRRQK